MLHLGNLWVILEIWYLLDDNYLGRNSHRKMKKVLNVLREISPMITKESLEKLRLFQRDRSADALKKELLYRAECMKRNFTKRQMNIIIFIHGLTYLIGRDEAIIPNMQDFELCGVSKTKVRDEVDKLEEMNVIECRACEEVGFRFKLVCPSLWEAPYHHGFNEMRAKELVMLNFPDNL